MKTWIADQFLHFGWALFGQECDCGHNNFNWLAARVHEGRWDAEGNPANTWTKIKFNVGHFFVSVHNWLERP